MPRGTVLQIVAVYGAVDGVASALAERTQRLQLRGLQLSRVVEIKGFVGVLAEQFHAVELRLFRPDFKAQHFHRHAEVVVELSVGVGAVVVKLEIEVETETCGAADIEDSPLDAQPDFEVEVKEDIALVAGVVLDFFRGAVQAEVFLIERGAGGTLRNVGSLVLVVHVVHARDTPAEVEAYNQLEAERETDGVFRADAGVDRQIHEDVFYENAFLSSSAGEGQLEADLRLNAPTELAFGGVSAALRRVHRRQFTLARAVRLLSAENRFSEVFQVAEVILGVVIQVDAGWRRVGRLPFAVLPLPLKGDIRRETELELRDGLGVLVLDILAQAFRHIRAGGLILGVVQACQHAEAEIADGVANHVDGFPGAVHAVHGRAADAIQREVVQADFVDERVAHVDGRIPLSGVVLEQHPHGIFRLHGLLGVPRHGGLVGGAVERDAVIGGVFGAVDADEAVLVVDVEPRRGGRNGAGRRDLRHHRQGVIGNHGSGAADGGCRAGVGKGGRFGGEAFQRGKNRQAVFVLNVDLSVVVGAVGADSEAHRAPVFRDGDFHLVLAHSVGHAVGAGNADVGPGDGFALDFRTVDNLAVSLNRGALDGRLVVDQPEEGIPLADDATGDEFARTLVHLLDELVVVAHVVNVELDIDFVAVDVLRVGAPGGLGTGGGVGVLLAVVVAVFGHVCPARVVAVGGHRRDGVGVSGARRVDEDTALGAGSLHSGGVRDGLVGRGLLPAGEVGNASHAGDARQVTAPHRLENLTPHAGVALGGVADIECLPVGVGGDQIFVGVQHELALGDVLGIDEGVAVGVTAVNSLPQREGSDGTLSVVGSAVPDTVRCGGGGGLHLQPDGALPRQTHFVNVVLAAVGSLPDDSVVVGGGLASVGLPEGDDVGERGANVPGFVAPPAAALVLGVGVLERDGYFLLRELRINIDILRRAVGAVDDVLANQRAHERLRILESDRAVAVGGDIVIVARGRTGQITAPAQVHAREGQAVLRRRVVGLNENRPDIVGVEARDAEEVDSGHNGHLVGVVPVGGEALRRFAVRRGAGEVVDLALEHVHGFFRVEAVERVVKANHAQPATRIIAASGFRTGTELQVKRLVSVRHIQTIPIGTKFIIVAPLVIMPGPCLVAVRLKNGVEVVAVPAHFRAENELADACQVISLSRIRHRILAVVVLTNTGGTAADIGVVVAVASVFLRGPNG